MDNQPPQRPVPPPGQPPAWPPQGPYQGQGPYNNDVTRAGPTYNDVLPPPRPYQQMPAYYTTPQDDQHPPLPAETMTDNKVHEGVKNVLATLAILIIAPLLALLITAFMFQSYEVDGPSMEPTLQHADRLIVLKAGKTWAKVTHGTYIPSRGSIIVFTRHDASDNKQLIKRVIALPGERIVINEGDIEVYNKDHPNGFNPDKAASYGKTIQSATSGRIDLTVPKGEVFVLGDNRGNSLDSRIFGTVPGSDIAGRLKVRVFPFNKTQLF